MRLFILLSILRFSAVFILNMSHFISGVNLQGSLIFHMTPPQIIKPRIKRYLKSNTLENFFSRNSEARVIDHVCHRYSQLQAEKLIVEKQMFISNKCDTLKKKFKSSFNPNANGKTVENFFKDERMSLDDQINSVDMNLKHMAQGMPHRIELEKKYHSQLNIKMMSIQEAQRIEHQKEQYREWLDQTNNRTNSPNFNKMAFLFERLNETSSRQAKPSKNKEISSQQRETRKRLVINLKEKGKVKASQLLKQNMDMKAYHKRQRKLLTSLNKTRLKHLTEDVAMYYLH